MDTSGAGPLSRSVISRILIKYCPLEVLLRAFGRLLRGSLLLLRHLNPVGFGLLRIDVHVLRGAALIDLERLIRVHGWSWLGLRPLYQMCTLVLAIFKVPRCIIAVMLSDEGAATQLDPPSA